MKVMKTSWSGAGQQRLNIPLDANNANTVVTLDAESNKNIKEIEILLKRNWSFTYHIFIKEIERNI